MLVYSSFVFYIGTSLDSNLFKKSFKKYFLTNSEGFFIEVVRCFFWYLENIFECKYLKNKILDKYCLCGKVRFGEQCLF